ncbi:hypothetical protein [Plantactinospora sp. B5E13]|uniref:hypothetical protein n=1 Tax=unclassified Plantactinospora TaxID=2631981 RepID=UPI00325E0878
MSWSQRVKAADVGVLTGAAVIARSVRDPESFATISVRCAPYVRRYLARRLGSGIADDLLGISGVAGTFAALVLTVVDEVGQTG